MPPRASRTGASSGWAPRSATRPRSSTPAGRSGCASCARSNTWSRATATSVPEARAVARIGLLGGTFNPPHVGHMLCAQAALEGLGLDRVLLLPVHTPPHKRLAEEPGVEHRLALCRLASTDAAGIEVSRVEVDRPGPSYTIDTLRALHERAHPEDALT